MRAILLVVLMSLTSLCLAGPVSTAKIVSADCDTYIGWNNAYDCTTVVDNNGVLESYRGNRDFRKDSGREVFVTNSEGKVRLVLKPLPEAK